MIFLRLARALPQNEARERSRRVVPTGMDPYRPPMDAPQ
jgi:hypothetical protein